MEIIRTTRIGDDPKPNPQDCLKAFLEGLEIQNIDKLLQEGTADDFLILGKLMADQIKQQTHPAALLNRVLFEKLAGELNSE